MKLIKKLPPKYINGRAISYGIFWCDECSQEVERPLSNGKISKSCGCYRAENIRKHGETSSKLYKVWQNMKQRCSNINHKDFKDYGGRGITICSEWTESYIEFRDWALSNGYQENLQINRIENDDNYEPSNCNFVTSAVNCQNRINNIVTEQIVKEIRELDKTGKYTQKELAIKYNICKSRIHEIIKKKTWKNV